MAGTFSRSWLLLKESFAVLRDNPGLIVFPVISGICTLIVSAAFFVPSFFLFGGSGESEGFNPLIYVLLFLFYLVSYTVIIFFNAALIFCVRNILHGQPATFSEGMGMAWRNIGKILGWAAVAATVGMVLQAIRENAGWVGSLISGLAGMAWNLLTFFVVPVLVFEGLGPIEAIKRSGSIFKQTWGESMVGQFSIGAIFALLSILGIAPIAIGIALTAGGGSGLLVIGGALIAAVYWLTLAVVGASLSGIYRTALYDYATTGQVSAAFSQQAIVGAFRPKQQRKLFGA
jgi:hypothetical protein